MRALGKEVKREDGHILVVRPLWSNVARLYEIPESDPHAVGRFWCYRTVVAAVLAAKAWEVSADTEPVGWFDRGGRPRA